MKGLWVNVALTWLLADRVSGLGLGSLLGYEFVTDVEQHARISLDVAEMSDQLKAFVDRAEDNSTLGELDMVEAQETYTNGNHSSKGGGVLRTLQGFSTKVFDKATGLGDRDGKAYLAELFLFTEYFNSTTYGDEYTLEMLSNKEAKWTSNVARRQLALKTVQYQIVWMYVLYELAASLKKCFDGNTAGSILNWEEGLAFYAGVDVSISAPTSGQMLWTFANKRCSPFKTCEDNGVAQANTKAIAAFSKGAEMIQAGKCSAASDQMDVVRKQMQIALLQGIVYYGAIKSTSMHKANQKDFAEAWAFARGMLPFLNASDPVATDSLANALRFDPSLNTSNVYYDGPAAVYQGVYAALDDLCISCAEIGVANLAGGAPDCTTNFTKLEQGCSSALLGKPQEEKTEDTPVNVGLIVGLIVAALVIVAGLIFAMKYMKKMEKADEAARQARLNKTADEVDETGSGTSGAGAGGVDAQSSLQKV